MPSRIDRFRQAVEAELGTALNGNPKKGYTLTERDFDLAIVATYKVKGKAHSGKIETHLVSTHVRWLWDSIEVRLRSDEIIEQTIRKLKQSLVFAAREFFPSGARLKVKLVSYQAIIFDRKGYRTFTKNVNRKIDKAYKDSKRLEYEKQAKVYRSKFGTKLRRGNSKKVASDTFIRVERRRIGHKVRLVLVEREVGLSGKFKPGFGRVVWRP